MSVIISDILFRVVGHAVIASSHAIFHKLMRVGTNESHDQATSIMFIEYGESLHVAYQHYDNMRVVTYLLQPMCTFNEFISGLKRIEGEWFLLGMTSSDNIPEIMRYLLFSGEPLDPTGQAYKPRPIMNVLDLMRPHMFEAFHYIVPLRPIAGVSELLWPFIQHLSDNQVTVWHTKYRSEVTLPIYPLNIGIIEKYLPSDTRIRVRTGSIVTKHAVGPNVIVIRDTGKGYTLISD